MIRLLKKEPDKPETVIAVRNYLQNLADSGDPTSQDILENWEEEDLPR